MSEAMIQKTKQREKLHDSNFPVRIIKEIGEYYPDKFDFSKLEKQNYFFFGKPGTGKSTLAAGLAMHFAGPNLNGMIWCNVSEFLHAIKKTYDNKSEYTESQIIDRFARPRILILDDLGVEKSTDWSLQALYLLINRRYENMKITLCTSNYTPDDLDDKMEDGRLISRLTAGASIMACENQYRK